MTNEKVKEKSKPHISQVLTFAGLGWLFGVGLASFFNQVDYLIILIFAVGSIIFYLLVLRNKIILFFGISLIFMFLGVIRYQNYFLPVDLGIAKYNATKQEFTGIVIEEPDTRINHVKLTVEVNSVIKNKEKIPENGLVLLSVSLYPIYQYGDELLISCNLKSPEIFEGFAYDKYLAKEGIYSTCSFAKVKIISRGNGDWGRELLINIKGLAQKKIDTNLPEPHASIGSAMIFGARKSTPPDLTEALSKTGSSHIVAVSGMHIAIIGGVVAYILIFFGWRRQYLVFIISPLLLIYVVMIGSVASAVRSAIMGFILLVAISTGRLSIGINILLISAVVMTIFNPLLLRDDIGFQLSFSAILGIMKFSDFFTKLSKLIIRSEGISKILAVTLSATIATAPFTIWHFGRLSLVGVVVNILVVPVLPLITILILASIFFSFIFPTANYFFWPAYFILEYMIEVIFFFSKIPYSYIDFL